MARLHELVSKSQSLKNELAALEKEYLLASGNLETQIDEHERLINIALGNINIDVVQIAEKIIYCYGKVNNNCEGRVLTEEAINDIANGCEKLKVRYLGNKQYDGFYQQCDCSYGYGPRHGSIIEEIGLKDGYRNKELTDDEKDACIYYLKNWSTINEAAKKKAKS